MRKRVGRAVAVVGIAVGMLLVGGIGLFRAVGSSPRPVVRPSAPAVTAPPVVVTGSLTEQISILQARLRLVPNDWSAYASLGADYVQQARITADPTYYPKAQGVLQRSLALRLATLYENELRDLSRAADRGPSYQVTSPAPARTLATRASMKRRSDRRLR